MARLRQAEVGKPLQYWRRLLVAGSASTRLESLLCVQIARDGRPPKAFGLGNALPLEGIQLSRWEREAKWRVNVCPLCRFASRGASSQAQVVGSSR